MNNVQEPTIWQGVPLNGDSIRLLTVYDPTADASLIQCSLKATPLPKKKKKWPGYAALSYTWGAEPLDCTVEVNSKTTRATKSCYEAPRCFETFGSMRESLQSSLKSFLLPFRL